MHASEWKNVEAKTANGLSILAGSLKFLYKLQYFISPPSINQYNELLQTYLTHHVRIID